MDELTAALQAFKAFRDNTPDDAYFALLEANPLLETLADALNDLEEAERAEEG